VRIVRATDGTVSPAAGTIDLAQGGALGVMQVVEPGLAGAGIAAACRTALTAVAD